MENVKCCNIKIKNTTYDVKKNNVKVKEEKE